MVATFLTEDDPPIVDVPRADAEMNAAIAHARETLPTFWASYDAPKQTEYGHCLKVRFAGDGYVEHIWMADVEKLPDGTYSGRFSNDPNDLPGKKMLDEAEFEQASITDWMFMRNGKIVGGETIRVVLKRMPKEDADLLRADFETH
jgi:uncharacterized protein YegJ (DUF2314 family)